MSRIQIQIKIKMTLHWSGEYIIGAARQAIDYGASEVGTWIRRVYTVIKGIQYASLIDQSMFGRYIVQYRESLSH